MRKLLWGIVLVIIFLMIDRHFTKYRAQSVDNTHKTAVISTADTTFNQKVEVTYPAGVGERIYSAKEINGKNLVATVKINGKLKPKNERRQSTCYITPQVIYILMDDNSMIVSKQPDVIAPITEEVARALLNQ